MKKARVIAFYLPQYHPVPANDAFWGKGFTEWTNVTKAKPLFQGHYQPNLPSDLGFYDLRVPEIREQQAELAREAGIEGFCYWHYWFGNRQRVLERVFEEVLETGKPNFPFCLGWANESWTGKWHGLDNEVIFKQAYPGDLDYIDHFHSLLNAFKDNRYIRVKHKPLFLIYRPELLPDCSAFCRIWNELAQANGLGGFHFVSNGSEGGYWCTEKGLSGFAKNNLSVIIEQLESQRSPSPLLKLRLLRKLKARLVGSIESLPLKPSQHTHVANYSDYARIAMKSSLEGNEYPVLYPNWDSSPRLKERGYILINPSAELFADLLAATVEKVKSRDAEERIIFIKSWNEWAEGNMLEPSALHGCSYLRACSKILRCNY